ncbi:MAG: hypothetical protein ABII12_00715 [Planctomycetota bacterium]
MAEAIFESQARSTRIRSEVARDIVTMAGLFTGLSLAYWLVVALFCGGRGFPLDDAFIHLQFARNLLNDGQMAFNPGVPSSGSTAPLYPMVLAAVHWLVRDWYVAAYVLGSVCSFGTTLVAYGIIRSWTGRGDLARWAGLLTVIMTPTVVQAYSGMEAAAYSLLFMIALWCYGSPGRRILASGLLAAGIWLRPEFMVLLPVVIFERWVALYRQGSRRPGPFLLGALPHVAVWAVVVLLYVAYHWHQDHHLLPSTFAAKFVAPGIARPEWLDSVPAALRRGHLLHLLLALTIWPFMGLVLAGVGIGINCAPVGFGIREALGALWRCDGPLASGWRFALLSLIGYPYLRGFVDSLGGMWFQQQRYYALITPLAIVVIIGAIPLTGVLLNRPWWSWKGVPLRVQMRRTFVWAGLCTLVMGAIAAISVSNINSMQVPIGHWVRENTTEDQLIATNDIGAIAFVGQRRILDTVGLVEPDVVEHLIANGGLLGYLQQRDPAYVIIFPTWYEDLSKRTDMLQVVKEFPLDFNVVCGGPTMVVYRPRWNDVGVDY